MIEFLVEHDNQYLTHLDTAGRTEIKHRTEYQYEKTKIKYCTEYDTGGGEKKKWRNAWTNISYKSHESAKRRHWS